MGLGRASNDTFHIPNLIDTTFKSHHSNKELFSMCIAEEGGFLTVGGPNTKHHLD